VQLTIIGSSSKGNGYILQNDTEALILELGVNFSLIKQVVDFNLDKIVGAFVTHEHGDHSKFIRPALKDGIDIYMSNGTKEALKLNHHRIKIISHMKKVKVGGFTVIAFDANHDCAEPLAFIISHEETGRICFITDSMFIDYTFPGINHFLVEANYCEDIIKQNVIEGKLHPKLMHRSLNIHMSIQTCRNLILANDLSKVNNIILLHLSDKNSDADRFLKDMQTATGKKVTIARPNLVMELNLNPF
jgi:phosphoribosyl 1,2-cyclic phosphodiesterase